jgi:acyl dehydratase
LGLAAVSGLTSHAPRVDTLAFLAILEWRFLRPIAFGDTIHVISRVESVEMQARGSRGIVTWSRRVVNQKGEIVQEGRTQTLVSGPRRGPGTVRSTASGADGTSPEE